MEITHLVVNGCSWTYCEGLDDPKTQGWPALVAKELGIPIVNIAVPGSGNDAICRRTYEYVYKNLPTGSKPLFIIFWSQYWRREAWHKLNGIREFNEYIGIHPHMTNGLALDDHQKALLANWDDQDFIRRTLLHKLSTMNLFRAHAIPYLMTDYGGKEVDLPNVGVDMKREIDTDPFNFYKDVETTRLINSYPKLPCQHDGPEAQKETAKWVLKNINVLIQDITPQVGNYLTLADFGLLETKMMWSHQDWK